MFRTGTNCYMKGHKHGFCSEVWIIYSTLLSAAGDANEDLEGCMQTACQSISF